MCQHESKRSPDAGFNLNASCPDSLLPSKGGACPSIRLGQPCSSNTIECRETFNGGVNMRSMKKWFALAGVFALGLLVAACGAAATPQTIVVTSPPQIVTSAPIVVTSAPIVVTAPPPTAAPTKPSTG